jgi:hypothetical protein
MLNKMATVHLYDYAYKFDKVELTKLYLDKAELTEIAAAYLPSSRKLCKLLIPTSTSSIKHK